MSVCLCASWWHTSCSIRTSCWSCLTLVVSWRSRRCETVLARYSAAYQQVATFVYASSPGMPSCLQTRLSKLNWNNTFSFISPAFISSFFRLGWNLQRQPLGIIRAVFTGQMPFLSSDHQCQTAEWSLEQWHQPGKSPTVGSLCPSSNAWSQTVNLNITTVWQVIYQWQSLSTWEPLCELRLLHRHWSSWDVTLNLSHA